MKTGQTDKPRPALHAGICIECGLPIYTGDWIMQSSLNGVAVAKHATHFGYISDGQIAQDYLDAGRSPELPRPTRGSIARTIKRNLL